MKKSKFSCELIDKETIEYKGIQSVKSILKSLKYLYNGNFKHLDYGKNNKLSNYKVTEFVIDTRNYNIPGFKENLEKNGFEKLKFENPYIVVFLKDKINLSSI